jgi:membrane protein implicated in regulation of membrane protease activity
MKFLITNIITLIICTTAIVWPLWELTSIHWWLKLALSFIALIVAGFFVERVTSKITNKLISLIYPDKK